MIRGRKRSEKDVSEITLSHQSLPPGVDVEKMAELFSDVSGITLSSNRHWVLDRVAPRGTLAAPFDRLKPNGSLVPFDRPSTWLRIAQGERIDFGRAELVEARHDLQSSLTDSSNTHE
jgi:hypothetical protein